MQVEILYRPSYSVARVLLERDEKIQVESGAMLGMSPDMQMETEAKGGVLKVAGSLRLRRRELLHEHLHRRCRWR